MEDYVAELKAILERKDEAFKQLTETLTKQNQKLSEQGQKLVLLEQKIRSSHAEGEAVSLGNVNYAFDIEETQKATGKTSNLQLMSHIKTSV